MAAISAEGRFVTEGKPATKKKSTNVEMPFTAEMPEIARTLSTDVVATVKESQQQKKRVGM
jgi:hypothetical protein